jgi:hypothetical protein
MSAGSEGSASIASVALQNICDGNFLSILGCHHLLDVEKHKKEYLKIEHRFGAKGLSGHSEAFNPFRSAAKYRQSYLKYVKHRSCATDTLPATRVLRDNKIVSLCVTRSQPPVIGTSVVNRNEIMT